MILPRAILHALSLQLGDNVALFVEDGRMLLRRLTEEELTAPRSAGQVAELFADERK